MTVVVEKAPLISDSTLSLCSNQPFVCFNCKFSQIVFDFFCFVLLHSTAQPIGNQSPLPPPPSPFLSVLFGLV
jgi:hypothetical protein